MEKIIYKKREGAPFKEKDTKVIAEIIVDIEKKKGIIKPVDLIGEAEGENSLIHHLFEWDDTEAAREYRLHQARNIINHIEIEVRSERNVEEKSDIVIHQQKAFHNVINGDERGYVSTVAIVKDEDLVKQVVKRLIKQLEGAEDELKAFNDYRWLVQLLGKTKEQIKVKIKV